MVFFILQKGVYMHPYDVDNNLYFVAPRGNGKPLLSTYPMYLDPSPTPSELTRIYDTMEHLQDCIDSLIDSDRCAATLYDDTNIVNQTLEQEAQDFEEFMREFW